MGFDILKTHKNPGKLWYGLSVPAANAEVTLLTDGSPDLTENPNAKFVGLTESGSTIGTNKTFTEENFDEFKYPLERTLDQSGLMIKCSISQVWDWDVLIMATAGIGTDVTKSGKKKLTFGEAAAIAYGGFAVIAPLKEDPTKFGVFHIYKGFNVANMEAIISRQTRSKIDLEIQGVAIPTRASSDTVGALWKQIA